jgi:hypothetical protein
LGARQVPFGVTQGRFGARQPGAGRGKLRLVPAGVDDEQDLPGLHVLPLLEAAFLEEALDARAQIDCLPGLGAADELEGLVDLLRAHHRDRHRRRRRLLRLLRGYARLLLASGELSEGHAQRRGGRRGPTTSSRGHPLHRTLEGAGAGIAPIVAVRLPIAMICISLPCRCRESGVELTQIMAATRPGGTNGFAVRSCAQTRGSDR